VPHGPDSHLLAQDSSGTVVSPVARVAGYGLLK
jgi:hypothetical protein